MSVRLGCPYLTKRLKTGLCFVFSVLIFGFADKGFLMLGIINN